MNTGACLTPKKSRSPSEKPMMTGTLSFCAARKIAHTIATVEALKCPIALPFCPASCTYSRNDFIIYILAHRKNMQQTHYVVCQNSYRAIILSMKNADFLSIGDITVDSFIRIKDASMHCELNRERCQLCVDFGEKIPFESVETIPAVGNAANAAVAASRLGIPSAIVTDLGDDNDGKDSLARLKKENVSTELATVHAGMPTNHHFVLWYEDERTILVHHTSYPYSLPTLPACKWMYLTSIGLESDAYHAQIAEYLDAHPETKLMFQPGTFQIKMGKEKLATL